MESVLTPTIHLEAPKPSYVLMLLNIPRSTAPALLGIIMPVPSLRRNLPPDGF